MPTKALTVENIDPEILDLAQEYVRTTGHALHVCAAFLLADQEPPYAQQGFTAQESAIIQAHYAKYDPHGSRADAEKYAV